MAKETWLSDLRRTIKRENGAGWSVREHRDKTQLTRRLEDGSRSSAYLPVSWGVSHQTAIAREVKKVRELMAERNISLPEAAKLLEEAADIGGGDDAAGANWPEIAERFLATKADRRATTLADYRTRIGRALEALSHRPYPRDGRALFRKYAQLFFDQSPAGGSGRKRALGDVAAFLKYGVERCGAPTRWLPLEGEELAELIGSHDKSSEEALTPPIKPDQLAGLLDQMEADGKYDLRLATALVGLYGLRPAELGALIYEDGNLRIGVIKRNSQTMGKTIAPRLALPLDLNEMPGEGARCAALWASGQVKLPLAVRNAIEKGATAKATGDAYRQLLERYKPWQTLAASTPGLTPYSLRHGFAWRAHKYYQRSMSVRDASALMGHSPQTHHKHYGRWTDEQGLLDAVALLNIAATPKEENSVK